MELEGCMCVRNRHAHDDCRLQSEGKRGSAKTLFNGQLKLALPVPFVRVWLGKRPIIQDLRAFALRASMPICIDVILVLLVPASLSCATGGNEGVYLAVSRRSGDGRAEQSRAEQSRAERMHACDRVTVV